MAAQPHLLHHHFSRHHVPILFSFFKPLFHISTTSNAFVAIQTPVLTASVTTATTSTTAAAFLFASHSAPRAPSPRSLGNDVLSDISLQLGDEESELELERSEQVESGSDSGPPFRVISDEKRPRLSVKEKKELASYAHGLGKKLKCQQVGKSGVTASVATALVETLEANELLKIKIQRSCPEDVVVVVKQLEDATGSVVVGQIGRTLILYRPSLTKLKAEEKKRQARRVFVRKEATLKPTLLRKAQEFRPSGHGRRGSSRV